MNTIKVAGIELQGSKATLFQCVSLAMDLSATGEGEVEVLADGVKVGGFTGGKRTFPPKFATLGSLNLQEVEERMIERAMQQSNGDTGAAARLLGLGRTTLYRKLKYRFRAPRPNQVQSMRRAA